MTQDPRIERTLAVFDEEEIPHSPPEHLPLIRKFRENYPDHHAFADDEIEVLNRAESRTLRIHAPITFQKEFKKRFSFLNAGFPVNFDGRTECLPTRIIQATHVLLFEAGRQALRSKNPGFEMINAERDAWIFDQALNEL